MVGKPAGKRVFKDFNFIFFLKFDMIKHFRLWIRIQRVEEQEIILLFQITAKKLKFITLYYCSMSKQKWWLLQEVQNVII